MIRTRDTKNGKKSYQAIVRVKGYPEKIKTFSSKRDSQNWELKVKAAMKSGRYQDDVEAQRRTLSNAIDRYTSEMLSLKTKNYRTIIGQLKWWKGSCGKYSMAQITPDLISRAKEELAQHITPKGKKRTPATVNRYLAALSVILSTARDDWGWIHESPMSRVRKLREPRGRVRFLNDLERDRLLQTCREGKNMHLYPIVVLALSTGMRYSEILTLKRHDLDLETGRAILHETKNGERRAVPITGHALEELKKHAAALATSSVFIFPSQKGSAPAAIRKSWRNAVRDANIKDFRFHDLRHSAASYLAMNQATSGEIAEVLGHKTLAMVKRYAHLSEAHTKNIVSKMNDVIFGKTA